MILERLRDLHARVEHKLPPAYHKKQRIQWILALDEQGNFLNFEQAETGKKAFVEMVSPYRKRAGIAPNPFLLADKPSYVLGLPDADTEKARAQAEALVGSNAITRDELGRFIVQGNSLW